MSKRVIIAIVSLVLVLTLACQVSRPGETVSSIQPGGWSFQVIQDGRVLLPEGETYQLAKRPFLLQLTFPEEGDLLMNVQDDPTNFDLDPSEYCQGEVYVFCPGTGVAEGGSQDPAPTDLVVDPEGSHFMSLTTRDRWATLATSHGIAVGTRFVDSLSYPAIGEPSLTIPIEEFEGEALYFVIFLDLDTDDIVDPGEIGRFILSFPGQE